MKHLIPALIGALTLASATAAERNLPVLRAAEQAFEVETSAVTLPDRVPSTLTFRQCTGCAPTQVQLTADTRFFLGKTAVTLARFKERPYRADAVLGIFVAHGTTDVTRIVDFGATPPRN